MVRKATLGTFKPARMKAALKPIKSRTMKNFSGAASNKQIALSALAKGVCLILHYDGCHRIVEVHTVGTTTASRPAMSAFQVDGETNTSAIPDWRIFCFDECFGVALSDLPSAAPRPEYKKGAKQFERIDAEA